MKDLVVAVEPVTPLDYFENPIEELESDHQMQMSSGVPLDSMNKERQQCSEPTWPVLP